MPVVGLNGLCMIEQEDLERFNFVVFPSYFVTFCLSIQCPNEAQQFLGFYEGVQNDMALKCFA